MNRKTFMLFILVVLVLTCHEQLLAVGTPVRPAMAPGHNALPGQLMVLMSAGPTYYCPPGERNWLKITQGQSIVDGDSLRTAAHGYLVLSWGPGNLIFVKPESGFRAVVRPGENVQLVLQLHRAELMVAARDSGLIEIEGRQGTLMVNHGDCSIVTGEAGELVRSVKGQSAFRLRGNAEALSIPEGYCLEVAADGHEKPLSMFDPGSEYESFRRFSTWLKYFETLHQGSSTEIPFKIDAVKVNGEFVSNLPQENGLHVLATPDGKLPQSILLQLKITPYPAPAHRFELYLGKDLVYALREGRDGYFEVNFAVPSFPEFTAVVHQVDSLDRRVRIFSSGFTFYGRRAVEDRARRFCRELTDAMARKDQIWLRTAISREYRDWQGNTWFDFINMSDETLRRYRDVRLTLHPFRFEQKDGTLLVSLNYRLSALTADWNFRYEDRGNDVLTLRVEDGVLKLYSKVSGMFFNRLKVAVDLRQGILRGRVFDERTRRPLSGVSINVRGTSFKTVTDSMGEYVIYNMPPGKYDVKFYKNGYGELTATTVTLKSAGEQF